MIAPVAFIDWNSGQKTGHVRFKTPHGARLASTYFSQEYIVQQTKDDTGTLWTKQALANSNQRLPCIELRILQGIVGHFRI